MELSRKSAAPEMVSDDPPAIIVVPWIETAFERGKTTAPLTNVVGGSVLRDGRSYELPPRWIRLDGSTETGVPDVVTEPAPGVTTTLFMDGPFGNGFIARPAMDVDTPATARCR